MGSGVEIVREMLSVGGRVGIGPLSCSVSLLGWVVQGFLLLGGHVGHVVYYPAAVAVFIAIPENELPKAVIESNVSPSIKGRRMPSC